MKKSTKLVSAVVVLAVLGGVYVGLNTYVSKEEKTESSEEESKTEVFSVKTDDIKSLEFIVDKKEVTFEKKDDSWVKKDETAFPVNQTTLDSAASAIKKVEADRVLEDVEDLTEYGLDSPSNTVTVVPLMGQRSSTSEMRIRLRISITFPRMMMTARYM